MNSRLPYRLGTTLAAAGLILTAGAHAAPGSAVASAATTPVITLRPTSGPPTSKVSIAGTGFGHAETVVVNFSTTRVLTATTSATGGLSGAFNVPTTKPPGSYRVTATGQTSRLTTSKTFLVRTNSPEFHFNAARTGQNRYENVLTPSRVPALVPAWTDTTSSTVNSSPAVVNGVAYVTASSGFFAFNAKSGTPLWSDGNPGPFFDQSSPAVVGGVAYAASVDGNFYAFNAGGCGARTCKPLWTAAIDGAGTVAQSSPVVANGKVYVSAGVNLYAFNAKGCGAAVCHPVWKATISPTNGQSPVSGQSSPTIVGGVLYVGGFEGLYAYNAAGCGAATCSPLWMGAAVRGGQTFAGTIVSSPAVVGGVAYIGAGADLFAFSTACASRCNPLWSFATGGEVVASPAVANGRVYIGSREGKMYVLNTSGTLLWTAATAFAASSSPSLAAGVVYIGAGNQIDAFNAGGCGAATCSPLWSAALTGAGFATPVIANATVYQGEATNGRFLAAFKLP